MPESTELDLKLGSGTVHAVAGADGRAAGSVCARAVSQFCTPLTTWPSGSPARVVSWSRSICVAAAAARSPRPGTYGLTAHARMPSRRQPWLGAERFDHVGWSMGALIGIHRRRPAGGGCAA